MVSKAEDVVVDDGIFLLWLWGKNDGRRAAVMTLWLLLALKSADVVPDRAAREKMIGDNLTMVNVFCCCCYCCAAAAIFFF